MGGTHIACCQAHQAGFQDHWALKVHILTGGPQREGSRPSGSDDTCVGVGSALRGARDKGIVLDKAGCTACLTRRERGKGYLLLQWLHPE